MMTTDIIGQLNAGKKKARKLLKWFASPAFRASWGVPEKSSKSHGHTVTTHGFCVVTLTAEHVGDGEQFAGGKMFCPLWEAFWSAGFRHVLMTPFTVVLGRPEIRRVMLFPPEVQRVADAMRAGERLPVSLPFQFDVPEVPPIISDRKGNVFVFRTGVSDHRIPF